MSVIIEPLLETEWDYAVLHRQSGPPLLLERKSSRINVSLGSSIIEICVKKCPHPIQKDKLASVMHMIPISDVSGASYYTESMIEEAKTLTAV